MSALKRPAMLPAGQTDNDAISLRGSEAVVNTIPKKLHWSKWRRWEQRRLDKLDRLLLMSTREERARIQAARHQDGGRLRKQAEAL